jgi:hypothetical protein
MRTSVGIVAYPLPEKAEFDVLGSIAITERGKVSSIGVALLDYGFYPRPVRVAGTSMGRWPRHWEVHDQDEGEGHSHHVHGSLRCPELELHRLHVLRLRELASEAQEEALSEGSGSCLERGSASAWSALRGCARQSAMG